MEQGSQSSPTIDLPNHPSLWKTAVLGGVVLVLAIWTGVTLNQFFGESFSLSAGTVWFAVAAILFLSFFFLSVLLIHETLWAAIVAGISGIAIAFPFIMSANENTVIGFAALLVLLVVAAIEGRREVEAALRIRFFRISRIVIYRAVLALAVFVAILFFNTLSAGPLTQNNPIIPQTAFEKSATTFSQKLSFIFGDVDLSLSLRQLAQRQVEGLLSRNGIQVGSGLSTIGVDQLIKEYQKKFEPILGTSVNPDIKLSKVLYDSLLAKFNGLTGSTRTLIMVVLAFLLLLTVTALSPIIRIVAATIAFLIYEIMLVTGFSERLYETKSKEIIALR